MKLHTGIKTKISQYIDSLDSIIIYPIIGLLYRYLARKAIYHYGAGYRMRSQDASHNIDSKTGGLGYGFIHYALIRNTKPTYALCIGSMYGFIPFMCAVACRDNGQGMVDFVDAGFDQKNSTDHDRHHFGQGFWKRKDAHTHFSYLRAEKTLRLHVMTTRQFFRLHPKKKYEYIYIDGDHSYEGVKSDYELCWKRLAKGGIMSFHDTHHRGVYRDIRFEVWRFMVELKKKHKGWIEFPNPASGLVILQKIEE